LLWFAFLSAGAFCVQIHAESRDRQFLAAAERGETANVKQLIGEGANPNFRRIFTTVEYPETTAFQKAVNGRHAEIVRLLLKQGLNDRILDTGITSLYRPGEDPDPGIETLFVEELLRQRRFDYLAKRARYINSNAALRLVLQHGLVNDPVVLSNAVERFHPWETVKLAADRLSDIQVLAKPQMVDRMISGYAPPLLPAVLVGRIRRNLHEEDRAVELLRDLGRRGFDVSSWGDEGSKAANFAKNNGLVALAGALAPGADGKAPKRPITDEDRMASAWYRRDEETYRKYLGAGVQLKGRSLVGMEFGGLTTLASELVKGKEFDRIEESGIDLMDWENPEENPYRSAKDLESIRWLLDHRVPFGKDPELLFWVLIPMVNAERVRIAEALIAAGADVQQTVGKRNWTILHALVFRNGPARDDAVVTLLKAGVDPDRPDGTGKSAIQYAEESWQIELLKLLDPGRKAQFWKKYGSGKPDPLAGAWSNEAEGFNVVTLILRSDGQGLLNSGGVAGYQAFWRMDGRRGFVDLVGGANLAELKVLETAVVERSEGEPNRLVLTLGGDKLELRKVAEAAEVERQARKAAEPVTPAPKNVDELRQAALQSFRRGKDYWVTLVDWPDDELPAEFRSDRLEKLEIRGGGLKRLPADLAQRFPALTGLLVEGVPLERCPPNLERLGKLRQVWLKNLNLRELPDIQLVNLASLDLSGNRLNEIPEGWLQTAFLETCFLANNRLDHVPPGLIKCSSLNHLDLSANQLTGIRIGDWPRIHELNLQENRLKQLPAEIGGLQTLEYLRLAGNSLQSLSESMRGMKALRVLDLSHNDFAILPDVLNHLTGLRSVPFKGTLVPEKHLEEAIKGGLKVGLQWEN
jgi:Leucine-rich repeat (LRR) protein/ankyrin repeat protein